MCLAGIITIVMQAGFTQDIMDCTHYILFRYLGLSAFPPAIELWKDEAYYRIDGNRVSLYKTTQLFICWLLEVALIHNDPFSGSRSDLSLEDKNVLLWIDSYITLGR